MEILIVIIMIVVIVLAISKLHNNTTSSKNSYRPTNEEFHIDNLNHTYDLMNRKSSINIYNKQSAAIAAPQCLRIVKDCANLVNTTTSPEIFFKRYDLMIENLQNLVICGSYISFKGNPQNDLDNVIRKREFETITFIDRAVETLESKLKTLKTQKAIENNINKFFSQFSIYESYLTSFISSHLKVTEINCRDTFFKENNSLNDLDDYCINDDVAENIDDDFSLETKKIADINNIDKADDVFRHLPFVPNGIGKEKYL